MQTRSRPIDGAGKTPRHQIRHKSVGAGAAFWPFFELRWMPIGSSVDDGWSSSTPFWGQGAARSSPQWWIRQLDDPTIGGRRFATPRFVVRGVSNGRIRNLAHRFLLAHHWHIWSISYRVSVSARPSGIWWQTLLQKLSLRRAAKMTKMTNASQNKIKK